MKDIEAALHRHLNDRIAKFQRYYAKWLTAPMAIHPDNALSSWEATLTAISETPHKLYLLIDE